LLQGAEVFALADEMKANAKKIFALKQFVPKGDHHFSSEDNKILFIPTIGIDSFITLLPADKLSTRLYSTMNINPIILNTRISNRFADLTCCEY
jgi:hypothetical protein